MRNETEKAWANLFASNEPIPLRAAIFCAVIAGLAAGLAAGFFFFTQ